MEVSITDIYLIQHAESKSSQEDPARPLSKKGEHNIRKVAGYVEEMGVTFDYIYHSDKLRAHQTAKILAEHLCNHNRVEEKAGLNPNDDVKPIKEWLDCLVEEVESLAIVGHLPFLAKLVSILVTGNEDAYIVAFQNAGIVKLIPKSTGNDYILSWILVPDLVM